MLIDLFTVLSWALLIGIVWFFWYIGSNIFKDWRKGGYDK